MKFFATYKCPLCNKLFSISEKPFEMEREQGPELVGKIIANQVMLGNPYLYQAPMHIPHNCPDGCIGIAQLAGFVTDSFVRKPDEQDSTATKSKRRNLLSIGHSNRKQRSDN